MASRLVLFAHGSRDPNWREPFLQLLAYLREREGEGAVALAFMEFAPPTLLDVARAAAAEGIDRLKLLPLFLAGGAHVAKDIPEQAAEVRKALPGMVVDVLPPIGEEPRFRDLLRAITHEHARKTTT